MVDPGGTHFHFSKDARYIRHFAQVLRFPDYNLNWTIEDCKLYFHRSKVMIDKVLLDLGVWMLVVFGLL